jgi:hypothetical protein
MPLTRLLAPLLALVLSACASVPLSTIARMSTFDERDFAALDGKDVRVKITLPEGFALDVAKSWLSIEIQSAAGTHKSLFDLVQEQTQATTIPGGLFADDQRGMLYELRLSAAAAGKVRELQSFIARAKADDISIRVVPRLSAAPRTANHVNVWIDLLLSPQDGYFRLVDGAEISLDKYRALYPGR